MKTMYPGMVNSPITEVSAAITAAQVSITVLNGAALPAAPNLFVIGQGELAETVLYTAKSGNTISGLTRGLQGTARAWPIGTKLSRNFTDYDYGALIENILETSESLVNKANLASPAFTGIPKVPTAAAMTSTEQAASTEFVTEATLALDSNIVFLDQEVLRIDEEVGDLSSQLADKANNWVKGKTVNFLGDSISAEGPGKVTYVTLVAEMLKCNTNNYAVGAQAFVGSNGFWSTVATIDANADMNVIMGGVNDYLLGVTIGTKDGADSYDTLYQAIEKFAKAIIARCPNAINVMITPLKAEVAASGATYSQDEVVKAIYFTANKYNFVVIDLYSNAPNFNPNIAALKTKWSPDGVHPNQDYVDMFLGKVVSENLISIQTGGNSLIVQKDYARMANVATESVSATIQKDLILNGDPQTTNNHMIANNTIIIVKTGIYLLNVHSALSAVNATGNVVCGIALNGNLFLNAVFDFTNLASEHKALNLSHVITLTKDDTLTLRVANNTNKSIDCTVNILTALEQ